MLKWAFAAVHRGCGYWHEALECPLCRATLPYLPDATPRGPHTFPFVPSRLVCANITMFLDMLRDASDSTSVGEHGSGGEGCRSWYGKVDEKGVQLACWRAPIWVPPKSPRERELSEAARTSEPKDISRRVVTRMICSAKCKGERVESECGKEACEGWSFKELAERAATAAAGWCPRHLESDPTPRAVASQIANPVQIQTNALLQNL